MKKIIKEIYLDRVNKLRIWATDKVFGLFTFNLIIMLLILLYSAGYFAPFFPLTINFIVLFSLIISILLLGFESKTYFVISLSFWIFAALLRILKVDVWAERTVIYSYQSLVVGIVLLIIELRREKV